MAARGELSSISNDTKGRIDTVIKIAATATTEGPSGPRTPKNSRQIARSGSAAPNVVRMISNLP